MSYACLPSRASRRVLLVATTVTAGAGMKVESTRPAAMSTAAGVVAIVLAPRAAVNTEGEDVRRRRFPTEPAAAVPVVVARTVVAPDRVSDRLYFVLPSQPVALRTAAACYPSRRVPPAQ